MLFCCDFAVRVLSNCRSNQFIESQRTLNTQLKQGINFNTLGPLSEYCSAFLFAVLDIAGGGITSVCNEIQLYAPRRAGIHRYALESIGVR